VADDPTPTETSATDQTPNPAPSDAPADKPQDAPADKPSDAPDAAPSDDPEPTALGGKPDDADAPKDDEAAKADVPEAYELTVPEGFEKLDDQAVADATPVFKELGLSNEQANKLVPVAATFAKRIIEQRDQQIIGTIAEQRKSWLEEAKADKDIGGANWDGTLQTAAKALDTLGFPKGSPLRNLLDESGLGNHPEMIRAFAKVGKAIGEDDNFPRGDTGGKGKKSDAELFYGPKG
jgi:hypothetical protein